MVESNERSILDTITDFLDESPEEKKESRDAFISTLKNYFISKKITTKVDALNDLDLKTEQVKKLGDAISLAVKQAAEIIKNDP